MFHTIVTINSNCLTTQHSLVSQMKACGVLCEVQSEHLRIHLHRQLWPLIQSNACSFEICGGQSGTGTSFLPVLWFSLSVSFYQLFPLIFILTLLLSKRLANKTWKPSNTLCSSRCQAALDRKVLFHCLIFTLGIYNFIKTEWPN